MIVMHAEITLAPDSREEALEHVAELAATSRTEPGVIDYRATTDIEEPHVVRVIELYDDEEAVEAHLSSEHFEAFRDAIADHVRGRSELYRYDVENISQVM
jgi:quinol monooxygenase YgiN